MALSEHDKNDVLSEIFNSEKINVKCGRHLYFGPVKGCAGFGNAQVQPEIGCADCWKVFFIHELATTPPDDRGKKLEELEFVVRNANQLFESGKWDISINPHATIEIEKDAE